MDKSDKDTLSKRVFYLEAALKKAWKEFNRLQKTISPDPINKPFNKPLENLKDTDEV